MFCTLALSANLVQNATPVATGKYLYFFAKNWTFLEFLCNFKEVKPKKYVQKMLVSLFLTLNIFYTLFLYFYC